MLSQSDLGTPRLAPAGPIVAGALAEMRFPEKISVTEAANRHRILENAGAYSGPWRESPHDVRFMNRAMDALGTESPYREVVVMGPSQTAKSELGNNWQLHTVIYDQADMLFVMPDKPAIQAYVQKEWNKMLEVCDDLRARQLDGPSADSLTLKQFRGCSFFFFWPTGPRFRSNPFSRGRFDDYDDIATDIGDQGDALGLFLGRTASFSMFGKVKVYVNSSPKLGRNRGIEALVAAGTDERWYVDCLACGQPFILDTEQRLHFDRTGTPVDAAASAAVICPDPECGGCHTQRDKAALMKTGRWVGRGETAVSLGDAAAGKEGELLPTSRLSQRWDGLMGFRRWSEMAEQWRTADLTFENSQDETALKTFYQTVIGKNYAQTASGEPPVTEDELIARAKASPYQLGEVPPEARCIIMAVDQQINRFEVAAWAFGPGNCSWLIDRFSITDRNGVPLRPFTRSEDFAVLYPQVLTKRYPVAGNPDVTVKPFGTVIDTGGLDDATDNAFAWWHAMVKGDAMSGRAPVPATAITLFKGGNKPNGKLLPPPTIDAKRQIKGAPQCQLYVPNVNRLKDTADVRLRRRDGGAGAISFPSDRDRRGELVVQRYIAEMRAETKEGDVWVRPPKTANETWDLYVMSLTVLLRFGGGDHSMDWVPAWARPPKVVADPSSQEGTAAAAALREAQGLPAREESRPAVSIHRRPQPTPTKSRPRVRITGGR